MATKKKAKRARIKRTRSRSKGWKRTTNAQRSAIQRFLRTVQPRTGRRPTVRDAAKRFKRAPSSIVRISHMRLGKPPARARKPSRKPSRAKIRGAK